MDSWRRAWLLLFLAVLLAGCDRGRSRDPAALAACLPPDLTLDTVIEASGATPPGKGKTVLDKLNEVGAYRGSDGRLYDRGGREIYFYKVQSRWLGAEPVNYREMQAQEQHDLEQFRRHFTVIEVGPPHQPA